MAPPTPQRTPTGRPLSSSVLPCASTVLRPSDCHLDVAPTTMATRLPFVLVWRVWLIWKRFLVCLPSLRGWRARLVVSGRIAPLFTHAASGDSTEASQEANLQDGLYRLNWKLYG